VHALIADDDAQVEDLETDPLVLAWCCEVLSSVLTQGWCAVGLMRRKAVTALMHAMQRSGPG
jgi:hypothetical protein